MKRFKISIMWVIGACAVLGMLRLLNGSDFIA